MNVLEVNDVHVGYDGREVLSGVNLCVARGEWCCLLGPNGVGKTTLLHCIVGRLQAIRGDIHIASQPLSSAPVEAKRHLGYACSPELLPGLLTGRQCLEVYAIAKELDSIDAEVLELAEEFRFSQYMDVFVDTYSLGTRQKLCVLLSLLGHPELIVLDEAFNGLDPRSALALKLHLRERVQQRHSSILLATHSLDIVEHYADTAALLMNGQICNTWATDEIKRLKSSGGNALESEIAAWSESGQG